MSHISNELMRRVEELRISRAISKVDGPRLAAAYLAKPKRKMGKARAKVPALTTGPCGFCGVRGSLGCDHFLPFVDQAGAKA